MICTMQIMPDLGKDIAGLTILAETETYRYAMFETESQQGVKDNIVSM